MKTEKRYANVGEKILITNSLSPRYEDGDIMKVSEFKDDEFGGVWAILPENGEDNWHWVCEDEYEVIIEE